MELGLNTASPVFLIHLFLSLKLRQMSVTSNKPIVIVHVLQHVQGRTFQDEGHGFHHGGDSIK